MLLETFELTAIDIRCVALSDLHALSVGVRWPHRADDWRLTLEQGRGIAALDEIGRVVGSAMWFPRSERFATIGMVITSPRLQTYGAGRWLMQQIMAVTGERVLGLNATRVAYRLYRSLGFRDEAILHQVQGQAVPVPDVPPLSEDGTVRPLTAEDLPALVALDAVAFGTDRQALLAALLPQAHGTVLTRFGRTVAYAICRPFGRGHVIGPLVAMSDDDAVAVAAPHVAEHAGAFLRVDTRQRDGHFAAFLARAGLSVFDALTTMSYNGRWPHRGEARVGAEPTVYALASQALN